MIALGIRAAQLLMIVIGGVLLWGMSAPLRARSVPPVEFVPLAPPQRNAGTLARYAVIGSRNLFQTPEVAEPIAPIQEVIAESKLNFKVLGTVAGPESLAVAVVQDATGKSDVISVNGELTGGVKVERIEKGRVVLLNNGRREALEVLDPQAPASLAMLQSGKESVNRVIVNAPPPPAFLATASPELIAKIAQLLKLQPRSGSAMPTPATPEPRPANRDFPPENNTFARTLPSADRTAASSGISATAGPVALASDSAFEAVAGQPLLQGLVERVNLRAGEEIVAVNGISVQAADRLPELLRSLTRQGPARVRITVDSTSEREIEVALP